MPIVLKPGRLNLLEPSGPVQACNGIALPLPLPLLPKYIEHMFSSAAVHTAHMWDRSIFSVRCEESKWGVNFFGLRRCPDVLEHTNQNTRYHVLGLMISDVVFVCFCVSTRPVKLVQVTSC